MPSAPDASTSVSLTPDAEPARSGRADDMMSSTPDTAAIPMPTPMSAPATTTPGRLPATTASASGDAQPGSGPARMATVSAVKAPRQSTALHRSAGGDAGSCERGTQRAASTRVTTTTGAFTRKTEPHQKWASSKPPTTGPTAVAVPPTPDHTAIALPRSCSGKMLPSTDSVDGIVQAPPIPMAPRPTAGPGAGEADAAATDAGRKTR